MSQNSTPSPEHAVAYLGSPPPPSPTNKPAASSGSRRRRSPPEMSARHERETHLNLASDLNGSLERISTSKSSQNSIADELVN
ncbi:Os08g0529350, partial [Oryza sativa Japonica Group]